MKAMYERTEDGVTKTITVAEALAEMDHAMTGGRHHVRFMVRASSGARIKYHDGRDVRLAPVAVAWEPEVAVPQAATVARRGDGVAPVL